ncbi:MAG: hypothetical protein R2838_20190 [Caldilineaceae bacterium]
MAATRKALARPASPSTTSIWPNSTKLGAGPGRVARAELNEVEITNVNGGAIALGHPLGCSGARILTTLIHEMHRRADAGESMRYGLATLCVGVGQGEATVIELVR